MVEKPKETDTYIIEDYSVFTRDDYNNLIKGDLDTAYEFYDTVTKDRFLTYRIVNFAIQYDVPVNISMSIVINESGMNPEATNYNEYSIDHGLYQLNSRTYRFYKASYLTNINNNVRLGNRHLKTNYLKTKTWEEAIISYNCGFGQRIPRISIKYLGKILRTEERLNRELIAFLNVK